jgi:hypothetical protein
MSVNKTDILILGVPLTHAQATALYKDIYGNDNYDEENEDNEVFMFTDSQNMYREVGYVYDEDKTIPHFLGVAITEDRNEIKQYLNKSSDTTETLMETLEIYNEFAIPLLEKYGVVSKEPTLTIVSQIG